jgi:predicted flap endonuclease-1-like 5' DNA nuclease
MSVAGLAAGTVITYIFGQKKINQRDAHIVELEGSVEARDGYIEELEGNVDTRDNKIKSLGINMKKQGATLEALNTDLSQRDAAIQSLEEQVRERDERIAAANAANAKLRMQNQETMDRAVGAEARVSELQELTQERDQEITALKAKERAMQDDFSHLDGVGPKISATLRSAGVKTFAKLASKEVDDLREILVAENPSLLRLSDPTTWPQQAGMAAEGRWETLKALQEDLKERRRQERLSLQESPEIATPAFVADA